MERALLNGNDGDPNKSTMLGESQKGIEAKKLEE